MPRHYLGLALILPNASSLAMQSTHDKSNGSAIMNFLNMGTSTLLVYIVGYFSINKMLLAHFYLFLAAMILVMFVISLRIYRGPTKAKPNQKIINSEV